MYIIIEDKYVTIDCESGYHRNNYSDHIRIAKKWQLKCLDVVGAGSKSFIFSN